MPHIEETLARTTEWQSVLSQTRGNAALARQILSLLAEELPGQCVAIDVLIERQAWQEASKIIHKIHGSASFCGLSSLKTICATMELQLRRPGAPEPRTLESFRDESSRLLAILGRLSHRQ